MSARLVGVLLAAVLLQACGGGDDVPDDRIDLAVVPMPARAASRFPPTVRDQWCSVCLTQPPSSAAAASAANRARSASNFSRECCFIAS